RGALSPPLTGKPGLTCTIAPNVLPPSLDLCITTFRSPVSKAQLPEELQMKVIDVRFGPYSQVTYTTPSWPTAMKSRSPQVFASGGTREVTCGKVTPGSNDVGA